MVLLQKRRKNGRRPCYAICIAFFVMMLYQPISESKRHAVRTAIVGYHRSNWTCGPTLLAHKRGIKFFPIELDPVPESNKFEAQLYALRTLQRSHSLGGESPLHRNSLILAIDLAATDFRIHIDRSVDISADTYNKLMQGKVFTDGLSDSSEFVNFAGLAKYLSSQHDTVLDSEKVFFCNTDELSGCDGSIFYSIRKQALMPNWMKASDEACSKLQSHCKCVSSLLKSCSSVRSSKGPNAHEQRDLAHFWINRIDDDKRRKYIMNETQHAFAVVESTRINAFTAHDMTSEVFAELSDAIPKKNAVWNNKILSELACTMSHLSAIKNAYSSGVSYALITEDDVSFPANFEQALPCLISEAPEGWETLQLLTVNPNVLRTLSSVYVSKYVKWYPSHWSSAAYVITRSGMELLLSILTRDTGLGADEFRLHVPRDNIYRADEVLFKHTQSYTVTDTQLKLSKLAEFSSIQVNGVGLVPSMEQPLTEAIPIFTPRSIMVITTARIRVVRDFRIITRRVVRNFHEVLRVVPYVQLYLYLVCIDDDTAKEVEERLKWKEFNTRGVNYKVSVDPTPFNKFFYIAKNVHQLSKYDKILLFDSDMNLLGFPLPEFFNLVWNYVVGGSVHQNVNEMLEKSDLATYRQWFKVFDGVWWQQNAPDVLRFDSTFVEQSFVLLDAGFAEWFFRRVLSHQHLMYSYRGREYPRESDFGPDLLWCGAAADWLQLRGTWWKKPCAVTTLPVNHEDDRQRGTQSIDQVQYLAQHHLPHRSGSIFSSTWIERRPLDLYKNAFPTWYRYSRYFVKHFGGTTILTRKLRRHFLRDAMTHADVAYLNRGNVD